MKNKMLEKHGDIKFAVNLLIYMLYIIIIPIILYDMFLIIQTIINPNSTPNFFGYKTFSIVSGSMEPTININDIVIVKKADRKEIQKDDIITFTAQNEIITHRIINIKNEDGILIYTTKGDSNEVTDIENVEYNQIEGRYVTKIPKIGKLFSILKNKSVFSLILILLIICYIIQKKSLQRKEKRKEKRKKYEREKGLQ
ncbi:MAG: signal peptidase I [Clostridia bacterium]|nr:signal peptidase I [Clostridia bacterium]